MKIAMTYIPEDKKYEIFTTKHYDAKDAKGLIGKLVCSAWAADHGPQKNAAFNEYRKMQRTYGKKFGWRESQEVFAWIDSLKTKWYHERLEYKTGAPF